MERLAGFRFFCSHNCFEVFDSGVKPWGEPSELDGLSAEDKKGKLRRGWYCKSNSIVYRTLAQGNDHRIDVYRDSALQINEDADRVLMHNISIPSGKLIVFGLDTGEAVEVGPGEYILQCRAYNLGVEAPYDQPISDSDFLRRDDLERYELVLVAGKTDREGLICGFRFLDQIKR